MNKIGIKSAFIAVLAAIICIGGFMIIPLGAVPIVLQNVLCILAAVLIGGKLAGAPAALFLAAGLIGFPVYAGGRGGIGVWLGPTGGFLLGYLLGAVIAGFIAGTPSVSEKKICKSAIIRISLAVFAGMVILYIPGVIRFSAWAAAGGKIPQDKNLFTYTMGVCVLPYLPGDFLKTVVAIPVALKLRPIFAQYLHLEK